jgi:hypothetical protein
MRWFDIRAVRSFSTRNYYGFGNTWSRFWHCRCLKNRLARAIRNDVHGSSAIISGKICLVTIHPQPCYFECEEQIARKSFKTHGADCLATVLTFTFRISSVAKAKRFFQAIGNTDVSGTVDRNENNIHSRCSNRVDISHFFMNR